MALGITHGDWLAELVDQELAAHDPGDLPPASSERKDSSDLLLDARARSLADRSLAPASPAAMRRDAFIDRYRGHIRVILDTAAQAQAPFDPVRRRAELAALLATLGGEITLAIAADPGRPRRGAEAAVRRALASAEYAFAETGWPPGDPRDALPLCASLVAIERRLVARLAALYYRTGCLDESGARRRREQAWRDLALVARALIAVAAAAGPLDARRRRAVRHQIQRLRLPRELERRLRDELREPGLATDLVQAAPRRLHRFLLEQILRADALAESPNPERSRFIDSFASAAGMDEPALAALRAEAAGAAEGQLWHDGPEEWVPGEFQGLPSDWGDAADELMEKASDIFQDHLEAITREVKQTGELGQLLAKAATGTTLSADEKGRVKAQLIDLAKVVPALAIFAAPGGMLLLPLLAKLLPFSMLPSAWEDRKTATPPPRRPGGSA